MLLRYIPPREAGDAEVVGVGGELSVPALVDAYRRGVFPWPVDGYPLLWFCPPLRAVLDFDALHIPRRLARTRRISELTFTIDKAFDSVIEACQSSPRAGQNGTWITPPMRAAYCELHRAGHAHSVEAWDTNGHLAGGLYGVSAGGAFAGESMFRRVPDASRLALLYLIDKLRERGATWMDIQVMTPHLRALGAQEISRNAFLDRLEVAQEQRLVLFP